MEFIMLQQQFIVAKQFKKTKPCLANRFLLSILSVYMALNPFAAIAAPLVDSFAQIEHQATISTANNGITIVNIAAPNEQGISHNQFERFDVAKQGLILNNSGFEHQSILAGRIAANTHINNDNNARLIINEVTHAHRSQLQGYTEVSGHQADVIIANPYGISCNGCGFLNTQKVSLTTGVPEFNNKHLESIRVEQGDVLIEGLGLNAANIDKFDIMTRALHVIAKINANKLTIITGRNSINYQHGQTTALADKQQNKPEFSLDASLLGAMHAGSIHLLGTEAGVGVRSKANMVTDIGSLSLQADGRLILSSVNAQQTVNVESNNADIDISDMAYGENINLSAAENINLSGFIGAEKNIHLDAQQINNQAEVIAGIQRDQQMNQQGNLSIDSAEVNNFKTLYASNKIDVNAADFNNKKEANVFAQQVVQLTIMDKLHNEGVIKSNGDLLVKAKKLSNSGLDSRLSAQANIVFDITQKMRNEGLIVSAKKLRISAWFINNKGSDALIAANDLGFFNIGHKLFNEGNIQSAKQLHIVANTLENHANIQSNDLLTLVTRFLVNKDEQASISSNKQIAIKATENVTNYGSIRAQEQLSINSQWLSNHAQISSDKNLLIHTDQAVFNNGRIQSLSNMHFNAGSLQNNSIIVSAEDLTVVADSIINQTDGALIVADNRLNLIASESINNNGNIQSLNKMTINTGLLTNQSSIVTDQTMQIESLQLLNRSPTALLFSSNNMNLASRNRINNEGLIHSLGEMHLSSDNIDNSGILNSAYSLNIHALQMSNRSSDSAVIAYDNLFFLLMDSLSNQGRILSGQLLSIDADRADNLGIIASDKAMTLQINSLTNKASIQAQTQLNISSENLSNSAQISSANTLQINAHKLNNETLDATIAANNQADFFIEESVNNTGKIASGGNLTIQSSVINNRGIHSFIRADNDLTLHVRRQIDNQGRLQSHNNMQINADGLLNSGQIASMNSISLNAQQLMNQNSGASIFSANKLQLNIDKNINNYGMIQSLSYLSMTTSELNNNGAISSAHDLYLQSNTIHNASSSLIEAKNDLLINANNQLLNKGNIQSFAELNIHTKQLNNQAQIAAQQNLTITARDEVLNQGRLQSAQQIIINTPLLSNNTIDSNIIAQADIKLTINDLDNSNGVIYANNSIDIHTQKLNNNNGRIEAVNILRLNLIELNLDSSGLFNAGSSLIINTRGDFNNALDSHLNSNADVLLNIAGELYNKGEISSTKDITIHSNGLNNGLNAAITAAHDINIISNTRVNNNGQISADNNVSIQAAGVNNQQQGLIASGENLAINVTAQLNNQNVLFAGNNMSLFSNSLNNDNASIFAVHDLLIAADTDLNKNSEVNNISGSIEAWDGNLSLFTHNFTNRMQALEIGQRGAVSLPDNDSIFQFDPVFNGLLFDKEESSSHYFVSYWRDIYLDRINNVVGLDVDERSELISGINSWLTNNLHFGNAACPAAWDCQLDNSAEMINEVVRIARENNHHWLTPYKTYLSAQSLPLTTRQWECNDVYDDCSYLYLETNHFSGVQDYIVSSSPAAQFLSGKNITLHADQLNNLNSTISAAGNIEMAGRVLNNQGHALTQTLLNQQRRIRCHWLDCDEGITYSNITQTSVFSYVPAIIYAGGSISGSFTDQINNSTIKTGVSYSTPVLQSIATQSHGNVITNVDLNSMASLLSPLAPASSDKISIRMMDNLHTDERDMIQSIQAYADANNFFDSNNLINAGNNLSDITFNLPSNGLFVVNENNSYPYLIETNSKLPDVPGTQGSDYLLNRLSLSNSPSAIAYHSDIEQLPKRLGDAFFESQLIRNAVLNTTGRRFLNTAIASDSQQFQYLMDSALDQQQALQLTTGIALSAEQIMRLTKDMVWMVEQTVNGQKVLLPKLYLAQTHGQLLASGALISAEENIHLSSNTINNSGLIDSSNNMQINAQNDFVNLEGNIQAAQILDLKAGENLINLSGHIRAAQLNLSAGKDIVSVTLAEQRYQSGFDDFASHYEIVSPLIASQASLTSTEQDLILNAGRDINLVDSQLLSARDIILQATNAIQIDSLTLQNRSYANWDDDNFQNTDSQTNLSSQIQAEKNINMHAANININSLQAQAGADINLQADKQLVIGSVQNSSQEDYYRQTSEQQHTVKQQHVNTLTSRLTAQSNIHLTAPIIKLNSIDLNTTGDITIQAAQELSLSANKDIDFSYQHSNREESLFTTDQGENKLDENLQYNQFNPAANLSIATDKLNITLAQSDNKNGTINDTGLAHIKDSLIENNDVKTPAITEQYINERHEYEQWHNKSLNGVAQAVITLIVAYFTMGAGVWAAGSMGATITESAAMATAVNGAAIASGSTLATGSINAIASHQSIGSDVFKESLIAGVKGFASGYLGGTLSQVSVPGIETMPYGEQISQSMLQAGGQSVVAVIDGQDAGKVFMQNLVANVTQVGNHEINALFDNNSLHPMALGIKAGMYAGAAQISGAGVNNGLSNFAFNVVGDIAQQQWQDAEKNNLIAIVAGNEQQQQFWQQQSELWDDGGLYKVALHSITGGLMAESMGLEFKEGAIAAGASEALSSVLSEQLSNTTDKNNVFQPIIVDVIAGITSEMSGSNAIDSMLIAQTANRYNRQLHQAEIDRARALIEQFKDFVRNDEGEITDLEAEGRLIRTLSRLADSATDYEDGNRIDEKALSFLGANFINVSEQERRDPGINQQVVDNNPELFNNAQNFSQTGLTPNERIDRNNAAGAQTTKYAGIGLAALAGAPALISAINACKMNIVLCLNEVGITTGEVLSEGGTVGLNKGVGNYNTVERGTARLSDDLATTFSGGRYTSRILEEDIILYRAGTADRPFGQFFSKDMPISEIQTRIDKAVLPIWPGGAKSPIDTVFKVQIPAGTTIYTGRIGSQGGHFVGGTQQIVVKQPWLTDGVIIIGSSSLK